MRNGDFFKFIAADLITQFFIEANGYCLPCVHHDLSVAQVSLIFSAKIGKGPANAFTLKII